MRKFIVLLIVILALGGGYTAYWHKKADEFKQMFIESADALNTSAKPMTKDLQLLHYDSVAVTGFPFAMVIEVSKPVLDFPASAILAESQPQTKTPAAYEWVEEISYGENVTFTGNITGNHFTFVANGDRTHKSLVNRVARHTVVASSSTPLTCQLGVERPAGGSPWTMQPVFNDPKTFLAIFRSLDCNADNLTLKDGTSNATIATSDGFSFSASNEAADGVNHKMALKTELKKLKATEAFDAMIGDYSLMVATLDNQVDQVLPPQKFSAYGDQSLKLDVAYNGPTDMQAMADPGMHFHFDLNTLTMDNAAGHAEIYSHVSSVPEGNDRELSVAFHEHAEQTEVGDQLTEKRFVEILTALQKAPTQKDPVMQILQKVATIAPPQETVAKVWPKMHTLGKVAFDVDFNVKGPNQGNALFKHGAMTLDNFNITSTPYGITMKGKGNASAAGKSPVGDLTITCLACDALVTDLGNYAMRIESFYDQINQKPPFLNAGLIDATRQFLHGMAEDGNAKDLLIHFVMPDSGMPTISGKQVPEVMALYMATVAPHLSQPSPSAGGQPPAQLAPRQ